MAHRLELFVSVLERNIDNRGKTPPLSPTGYPLIEVKHIQEDRLYPVFEDTKFVDQTTWETWFRAHLEPGDILFSTVGSIARSCMVPERPKFCIAQNVLGFRVNRSKADPRFLYYAINDSFFQHEVHGRTIETVQKSIKVHDLKTCRIPLPSLAEQRAIANILGVLDDKIELNRRMNETLEAMARAIFQSWFVDFDPVRAKQDGQTPPRLNSTTAALFPDGFEDSELGHIPKGWKVGCVGDVGSNPRRTINPVDIKPGTPYIALEHMPRRSIALADWSLGDEIASGKCQFHRGEILFGKLRPYFHKVGVPAIDGVCSTDILVVVPKSPSWFGFLLGQISSDELIAFTDMASTGTKMPRTSWGDISRYRIVLPPESIAKVFSSQVRELIAQIHANIRESRTLAAIRDALLPKLLSGEIRVADAERLVEDAG